MYKFFSWPSGAGWRSRAARIDGAAGIDGASDRWAHGSVGVAGIGEQHGSIGAAPSGVPAPAEVTCRTCAPPDPPAPRLRSRLSNESGNLTERAVRLPQPCRRYCVDNEILSELCGGRDGLDFPARPAVSVRARPAAEGAVWAFGTRPLRPPRQPQSPK